MFGFGPPVCVSPPREARRDRASGQCFVSVRVVYRASVYRLGPGPVRACALRVSCRFNSQLGTDSFDFRTQSGSARRPAGSESADLIAQTKPTLHLILERARMSMEERSTSIIQRWMWMRTKPASSTVTSRLDSSSLIVDVPGPQGAVLSAKASVGAAWAGRARRGTQSPPPTRAPARAWRRPRKKRRCRWPPCGHCTRMGRSALWRASERCVGHQSFQTRFPASAVASRRAASAAACTWNASPLPRERPRPVVCMCLCKPLQINEIVGGLQARSREIKP